MSNGDRLVIPKWMLGALITLGIIVFGYAFRNERALADKDKRLAVLERVDVERKDIDDKLHDTLQRMAADIKEMNNILQTLRGTIQGFNRGGSP